MRLMNIRPGRPMRFYLAALPFVMLVVAYLTGSSMRLAENPNDKLLPAVTSMVHAVKKIGFEVDGRTGTVLMLDDTLASL
jgi:NitT/TauT family transport system permease protein